MGINSIILYLSRAIIFALPLSLIFIWVRIYINKRKGYKFNKEKELLLFILIFYILSLAQITVIRDGSGIINFFQLERDASSIQLIPILYTIDEANNGIWAIVYPVVGNIVWFIPLGFFITLLKPTVTLKNIFVVSLITSCTIELLQWIFQSGITDIDDIIFNAIGGILGYLISRFILKFKIYFHRAK